MPTLMKPMKPRRSLPGMPPLVAAYPTRANAAHHAIGELLALDWHPADAVAIADEPVA